MSEREERQPTPWREQSWIALRCPRCGAHTYGPEGNTYCRRHEETLMVRTIQPEDADRV